MKSALGEDLTVAMADATSQGIRIEPTSHVMMPGGYVCSVLSRIVRIPPFVYCARDNFSFVKIMSDVASDSGIMQIKGKKVFIVPLEDSRMQIVVVPLSEVAQVTGSLCDKVRSVMKDLEAS